MNVLTVLENETELTPMTQMISTMAPDADLMCFGSSLPALAAAREHQVDVALIDAELPELSEWEPGHMVACHLVGEHGEPVQAAAKSAEVASESEE